MVVMLLDQLVGLWSTYLVPDCQGRVLDHTVVVRSHIQYNSNGRYYHHMLAWQAS